MLVAASRTAVAVSEQRPFLKCLESADAYKGYTVNDVRIVTPLAIKTPLSFLFGSQQKLQNEFAAILPRLPMQKGGQFDRVKNSFSIDALRQVYEEQVVQPGERIRIAVVSYRLENCNPTSTSLDVVYVVYSSDFLYYASRVFEKPNNRITRSLAPGKVANSGALANTTNKFLPQPLFGYDDARKVFGGTNLSYQTKGGIINRMDLGFSGSPNSLATDLNLSGSREYNDGLVSHLDWRLAYDYFNLPTDDFQLKAGSGVAQLFGASRPLTKHGLIVRFGTSVETGNRQIDEQLPAIPPAAEQSGYRAVKSYLGATLNKGRQSWSVSYGLQLGSNGNDSGVGFVKHVFDAGYRARFLIREHDPIRLELNFSAGAAHSRSAPIPIVERFFGGNRPRPFIEGDDWIINSSPLIRSFPQYGLSRTGLNAAIGGTNFTSFNVTLSKPFWHIAAVPREISDDTTIRDVLAGGLRTARAATLDVYLSDEPQFILLANELRVDSDPTRIEGTIPELEKAFSPIPILLDQLKNRTPSPPAEVLESISELQGDSSVIDNVTQRLQRIIDEKDSLRPVAAELVVGVAPGDDGLISNLIEGLNNVVEALRSVQLTADADRIQEASKELTSVRAALLPRVNRLIAYGKIDAHVFEPTRAILKNVNAPEDVQRVLAGLRKTLNAIDQKADVVSNIGRSASLIAIDLKDAPGLAVILQKKKDAVSQFLVTQLSPDTLQQLNDYKIDEPLPSQLLNALVIDLNRVIHGPSIFNEARFEEVDLSDETSNLAEQNPQENDLVRLNRSLISEAFPDEISKSRLDDLLGPLDDSLADANLMLSLATGDLATTSVDKIRNSIHRLMIGYGDLAPSVVKIIATQSRPLQKVLFAEGLQTESEELRLQLDKLTTLEQQSRKAWNAIPLSAAERKTDLDIGYSERALDVVFRELNLIEVSPVLMFDVARIGPKTSPDFGNLHYGLGPALRFSVVTLDFTAGYAFNLNRKPAEGRGAFVFSMTISDLFR